MFKDCFSFPILPHKRKGGKHIPFRNVFSFVPNVRFFYVACFNSGAVFQQQQKGRESNVCYTSFALIKANAFCCIYNGVAFPEHVSKEVLL